MPADSSPTFSAAPAAAIILVRNATGVTIRNVIADGTGTAIGGCAPEYFGFYYRKATGVLDHVTARGLAPAVIG